MADQSEGGLTPPKRTGTEDPGAHELDSEESEDHFSDAHSVPSDEQVSSPVPKTRVEKVDDEPSYGEVPGTEAYRLREGDAAPDEIAIIPEEAKAGAVGAQEALSPTPGGQPIPKTMLEEPADASGSEAANADKKHRADPPPDLVLKANGKVEEPDTPISTALPSPVTARSRRKSSTSAFARPPGPVSPSPRSAAFSATADDDDDDDDQGEDGDGGDDFGDDFDDFAEGDDDEDFGDFDDADFQEPAPVPSPGPAPSPLPPSQAPQPVFPVPDFDGLDAEDIAAATEPYLNAMFPPGIEEGLDLPPLPKDNSIFLTPRSASLWSQLVAPPPLQPPDWIRSRIRRLFLVSLGVPVDLDEILPASKQKKLVLPSLHKAGSAGSLRVSSDSRSASRLKRGGANASSTSVDSEGRPSAPSGAAGGRKGAGGQPELDLVAAKQLAMTTDEALDGMTDGELQAHVARLREMEVTAKEVLEFWKKRADEKIGDREAFEGVIGDLVKHARKVRK